MLTCADVLARTLHDAGIRRMFGLPGGEILDFMDAARRAGIQFLLTRHEATASLMADVTGQIERRPGVCVSTLGPGAVNMTLGVANAYLDRSPVLAITATLARRSLPYATHQDLDLNDVYRPFTKLAITLDGTDTAAKVRRAIDVALAPRMGPVHIALPSDVARAEERASQPELASDPPQGPSPAPSAADLTRVGELISQSRRPAVILGLDLDPYRDVSAVRAFVDRLGAPVFVTPKAKGALPEDHPLFHGVCAGVAGDAVVLEWLGGADLLIGIGFEPVESDKLWHQTMPLVSIGPISIAVRAFRPQAEVVGDVGQILDALREWLPAELDWPSEHRALFRLALDTALKPAVRPRGLSGFELTRRLRELFPRDTILATDVGSVKMITTQAWAAYDPLTFFESNGLSAMSYSLPGAMAARLQFPDRPILCTIGDGGFGMTLAEIETCVRERIHFVTVVYNDSSLSLIDAAQTRRGYPTLGVRYGTIDFAAASAALGAWARRVATMDELDAAVAEGLEIDRPVVIDAVVDPQEYMSYR
jgi:acetolactate synthase-1/2/3 large subunit